MALDIGSAAAGTGLAGAIDSELDTALSAAFGGDYDSAVAEPARQAISDGIATAVINYFKANLQLNLSGVTSGGDNVTVSPPDAIE